MIQSKHEKNFKKSSRDPVYDVDPDENTDEAEKYSAYEEQEEYIEADVSSPHLWFPEARKMHRDIYFHMGPTNSGKTYEALQSLKSAEKGIYLAPLRLLAWEVTEKLREENVRCSLLTGQERSFSEFDTHISCTIEMCKSEETYDVAVIDEIQMIGDSERGWAWSNAFLSLKAKTIHLWGDSRSLHLISRICTDTGDTLRVKNYERMSKLKVENMPVRSFKDLRPGDCIVGFSRRILFAVK